MGPQSALRREPIPRVVSLNSDVIERENFKFKYLWRKQKLLSAKWAYAKSELFTL